MGSVLSLTMNMVITSTAVQVFLICLPFKYGECFGDTDIANDDSQSFTVSSLHFCVKIIKPMLPYIEVAMHFL